MNRKKWKSSTELNQLLPNFTHLTESYPPPQILSVSPTTADFANKTILNKTILKNMENTSTYMSAHSTNSTDGVPVTTTTMESAIEEFEVPHDKLCEGWRLVESEGYDSVLLKFGVRITNADSNEYMWYCLADSECRKKGTCVRIYEDISSNATRHLKNVHGISSERTEIISDKKRK